MCVCGNGCQYSINAFVFYLLSVVINVDFTPVDSFTNEEFGKEILLFKTEIFSNAFVLDSSSVEHKEFVVNVASNLSTHLPSL